MLHVTGISQSYGTTILSNISLVLGDGVKLRLSDQTVPVNRRCFQSLRVLLSPTAGKLNSLPGVVSVTFHKK